MRNGSRLAVAALISIASVCLAGDASDKKKQSPAESYSVIAGTVFREPGFALPEADVTLVPAPGGVPAKKGKQSFPTNTRGEFAFRVPPEKGSYLITAAAHGYAKQQKTVEVQPSERVDVTFTLAPESNK